MARVVLIAIVAAFLLSYGTVTGVSLAKGVRAGRVAAAVLLGAVVLGGAAAWGIYWATKHGALAPDDFYNSVAGNALVVGGLVAAAGAMLGVLTAIFTVLRRS